MNNEDVMAKNKGRTFIPGRGVTGFNQTYVFIQ